MPTIIEKNLPTPAMVLIFVVIIFLIGGAGLAFGYMNGTFGAKTTANENKTVVLFVPTSTALEPRGQWHHHSNPTRELAWLTPKLGLNDTQQGQIKPLLFAKAEQLKTISEDANLTKDQKNRQTKVLYENTNQQIESFLNPAQVQTFEQQQQHRS
jgi:hypothetical protein